MSTKLPILEVVLVFGLLGVLVTVLEEEEPGCCGGDNTNISTYKMNGSIVYILHLWYSKQLTSD